MDLDNLNQLAAQQNTLIGNCMTSIGKNAK